MLQTLSCHIDPGVNFSGGQNTIWHRVCARFVTLFPLYKKKSSARHGSARKRTRQFRLALTVEQFRLVLTVEQFRLALTVEQFRNFINGWGKDKMLQIYLKVGEKKDDSLCWCECWSEVLRPTKGRILRTLQPD